MSLFMDADLARRLERCEAAINASFVETHARLEPDSNAAWIDVAGTYAMSDGPDSPMTQTFGLGMFAPATAEELTRIERFFEERAVATHHEVCTLAGVATTALLVERGYRPIEQSTVLVQTLDEALAEPKVGDRRARVADPHQRSAWVECSVRGWSADPTFEGLMRGIAKLAFTNPAMTSFTVEMDGAPIATASLGLHEGVAMLAGASTMPEHRGRGAQAALLAGRLAHAREAGAEIAMMVADPGSTSQRNAERRGFRVAYTRTKWRLARS